MFCQKCGKEIADDAVFCQFCGHQNNAKIEQPQVVYVQKTERQPKSQFIAIVLCLFLGLVGIHDFYLERNGAGVAKLLIALFFGWLAGIGLIVNGIWCIIDFLVILGKGYEALKSNEQIEKEKKDLEEYNKRKKEYERAELENDIWK